MRDLGRFSLGGRDSDIRGELPRDDTDTFMFTVPPRDEAPQPRRSTSPGAAGSPVAVDSPVVVDDFEPPLDDDAYTGWEEGDAMEDFDVGVPNLSVAAGTYISLYANS